MAVKETGGPSGGGSSTSRFPTLTPSSLRQGFTRVSRVNHQDQGRIPHTHQTQHSVFDGTVALFRVHNAKKKTHKYIGVPLKSAFRNRHLHDSFSHQNVLSGHSSHTETHTYTWCRGGGRGRVSDRNGWPGARPLAIRRNRETRCFGFGVTWGEWCRATTSTMGVRCGGACVAVLLYEYLLLISPHWDGPRTGPRLGVMLLSAARLSKSLPSSCGLCH